MVDLGSTVNTPCVEWDGAKNGKGYGEIWRRVDGRLVRTFVHRLVWIAANGQVPEGLIICHRCDNPACYRLDHLFLGSDAANARDSLLKGRRAADLPRPEMGTALREARIQAGLTQAELGELLGCTKGRVSHFETGHGRAPRRRDAVVWHRLLNFIEEAA